MNFDVFFGRCCARFSQWILQRKQRAMMNSSWEISRISSNISSFIDDDLRNEIAMILSELTNLSFFAYLINCLDISPRFFHINELIRYLEECLNILWFLNHIIDDIINEKCIFEFFDLIDKQNWWYINSFDFDCN